MNHLLDQWARRIASAQERVHGEFILYRDAPNGISARTNDGRQAGYLTWNITTDEIGSVSVIEEHRRKGLASAMLAWAREEFPDLVHTTSPGQLSNDGAEWARAVGSIASSTRAYRGLTLHFDHAPSDAEVMAKLRGIPASDLAMAETNDWPVFGQHWTTDPEVARNFALARAENIPAWKHNRKDNDRWGVVLEATLNATPGPGMEKWWAEKEVRPTRSQMVSVVAHLHRLPALEDDTPGGRRRWRMQETYVRSISIPETTWRHAAYDDAARGGPSGQGVGLTFNHPRYYFHITRPANRESILATGLEAGRSLKGRGFTDPAFRRIYLALKPWAQPSDKHDVWHVDTQGLMLRPDPELPDLWWVSENDIPPSRLELL